MNQLQELEMHKAVKAAEFNRLFNPDSIRKANTAKKFALPSKNQITRDKIQKAFEVLGISDENSFSKANSAEMEEIMHPRNKGRYAKSEDPSLSLSNPTHKEKILDHIADKIIELRKSGDSFAKDDANSLEASLGRLEWGGTVDHNVWDLMKQMGINLTP